MSDYISKSTLVYSIIQNVVITTEEGLDLRSEIVDLIKELPTLDEKEIIRKAFERVVERLEKYKRANDMCRENAASAKRHENVRYFENLIFATEQAISMVKEEGGIE